MKRILLALAAGATLAYFLDPENGTQRRARARAWITDNINAETWRQAREITTTQTQWLGQRIGELRDAASRNTASDMQPPAVSATTAVESTPAGV
ncbi:MAG TPA: hypothetical protein VKQ36_13260 [Ktedonobacterales bacterium]|nr:hypothetical protein [Ktedonobacterales bacterium]